MIRRSPIAFGGLIKTSPPLGRELELTTLDPG
jgi:hypothetical protein